MSHNVSNALTPGNAGKYIVSIRLWPGGLSFAGIVPDDKSSFFCKEIALDKTAGYAQALKNAFFSNEFFTYVYKRLYVLCANRLYTLVPDNIFAEQQKERLMAFTFSTPDYKTLYEGIDGMDTKIVFGLQPDVYAFCSRSLNNPQYVHAVTRMLTNWHKNSLLHIRKQLYVALYNGVMHAACFDKGAALFVNSFKYEDRDDILYYTLYIWQQLGMDQMHDELYIASTADMYAKVSVELKTYLSHIQAIVPAWPEAAETPYDVVALLLCE